MLVPYVRGYGTTSFLSADTFRNGQPSAVALDTIVFMDALKIRKATLAGFDWGARSANIVAALWPDRCKAMVSVSGYLIGSPEAGKAPLPPQAELQWWYQFYFATERGRAGYDKYRHDFAKLIWQLASPKWAFDDATFDRSAAALNNPDHVAITIHNYRWRLALAEGEPKYDEYEKRLAVASGHCRAHDDSRRRCERCATSGCQRLCEEVLRKVFAPSHHGRYRPQPASGGAASLRAGGHRRRPICIDMICVGKGRGPLDSSQPKRLSRRARFGAPSSGRCRGCVQASCVATVGRPAFGTPKSPGQRRASPTRTLHIASNIRHRESRRCRREGWTRN